MEVINTNGIGIDANGITRTVICDIGPFTRDITLTGVDANVSMAPTPGWSDIEGFAELLVSVYVDKSTIPATGFNNPAPAVVNFGVGPGVPSGQLFSRILKTVYPQNAQEVVPFIPLNISLKSWQRIHLLFSYYSATVASDCEMAGEIQYQ